MGGPIITLRVLLPHFVFSSISSSMGLLVYGHEARQEVLIERPGRYIHTLRAHLSIFFLSKPLSAVYLVTTERVYGGQAGRKIEIR